MRSIPCISSDWLDVARAFSIDMRKTKTREGNGFRLGRLKINYILEVMLKQACRGNGDCWRERSAVIMHHASSNQSQERIDILWFILVANRLASGSCSGKAIEHKAPYKLYTREVDGGRRGAHM
jgi:hypothetical protein